MKITIHLSGHGRFRKDKITSEEIFQLQQLLNDFSDQIQEWIWMETDGMVDITSVKVTR